jgi:uncharacterized lipoprotein
MKKIVFLLFAVAFFSACGPDDRPARYFSSL